MTSLAAEAPRINHATKEQRDAGHSHVVGEKCDMCDAVPVVAAWQPYGGATSFRDADAYTSAQEIEMAADSVLYQFEDIRSNIWASPDLTPRAKAQALVALATELDERLSAAVAEEEAEQASGERAAYDPGGSFGAFKDATGAWRWLAIHTNKYIDREREIFSEQAHKDFVDQTWASGSWPSLRLFHVPLDIGRADFLDYDDRGFVVSSGTFLPGFEEAAKNLSEMEGLGCSHGFWYPNVALRDGVYSAYRSFEVTVLPGKRSANMLTAFIAGKEIPMLTPERKEFLEQVLGADRVSGLESGLRELAEIAEKSGLSYKSLEALRLGFRDDDAPAPAAVAVADPPAAADPAPAAVAEPVADPAPPAAAADPAPAAVADPVAPPAAAAPPAAEEPRDTGVTAPTPSADDEAAAAASLAQAAALAPPDDGSTAAAKALTDLLAPFVDALQGLQAGQAALAADVAGLKESRDTTLAQMIWPRVGPVAGVAASQSDANVVSEAEAARVAGAAGGEKSASVYAPIAGYIDDILRAPAAVAAN